MSRSYPEELLLDMVQLSFLTNGSKAIFISQPFRKSTKVLGNESCFRLMAPRVANFVERASPRQIWELGGLRPFWTAHRGCGTPSRSSRRYPGARLGLPDPNHSIQSTPRPGLTLGTYGVSAGPRRAPRCHRSIGPEEEFSYGVRMAQIGAGLRQGPQPGDADTPFRNNKPSTLTDSGGDCRWYRTSRREARHRRLCAPVRALFTHRHAMTPFSPGHCAHFERGAGSYT